MENFMKDCDKGMVCFWAMLTVLGGVSLLILHLSGIMS